MRAEPNELAAAQRAVEHHGGTVGQSLPVVNGFVAQVPAGSERALGAADGVAGVVADSPMKGWADAGKTAAATAATPGTTLADVREAIGADQSGATGSGVDVAVIDTGMVPVPALAAQGKVVQGPDFSDQSRDRDLAHLDTYGHGTHVAGIIAGDDPKSGFRGVAPGARLVNVKAAGADGSTSLAAIVASVGWVIAHRNDSGLHVRVLNLSFGTPPTRYQSDLLAYAVEQAWKAGIVVVVSAGNEGDKHRGLTSPAYDPFILSIGADDLVRHGRRGRRRRALVVEPRPGPQPRPRRARAARSPACATRTRPSTSPTPRRAWATTCSRAAARRRPPRSSRAPSRCCSSAGPTSRPTRSRRWSSRPPTRCPDPGPTPRVRVGSTSSARSPRPAPIPPRCASRSRRPRSAASSPGWSPGLSSGRHAEVGPVGPDGSRWGARQVGRLLVGRREVGRLVVGRLVLGRLLLGRLLLGRLLLGRLLLGRLLLGRLLLGRLVLGRRLSRARPGLHAT